MDIRGSIPEINTECISGEELYNKIKIHVGLSSDTYYLVLNGRIVQRDAIIKNEEFPMVRIAPRVLGGKGGFGSMLRAIGAQIEKTTNREACRDLSGRRLRDINEEKRLKTWINQQAEREKEAKERRKKKLEKQCELPKHEFKDPEYDKERSELPEAIEDALLQGLQASSSGAVTTKRKVVQDASIVKKKRKLWVEDELDEELSSDGSDTEAVSPAPQSTSEDSNQTIAIKGILENKRENLDNVEVLK